MKSLHAAWLSLCSLALCLGQGCGGILSSEPYHESKSYDLGVPAEVKAAAFLQVEPFSSSSTCKFKMLYRTGSNELSIDEFDKWIQPPGQLLTKYVRLAFRTSPGDSFVAGGAKYRLYATILAFEADLDAGKASLGVRYELLDDSDPSARVERTVIFSQPLDGSDAQAVAAAMSKAAAAMVQAVKKDLDALVAVAQERKAAAQHKAQAAK